MGVPRRRNYNKPRPRARRPEVPQKPLAAYHQAKSRIQAAFRSLEAGVRDELSRSLRAVERILASGQEIDASTQWLLDVIRCQLIWTMAAHRFATEGTTALEAVMSLSSGLLPRNDLSLQARHPRATLAAAVDAADGMRPPGMSLALDDGDGHERLGAARAASIIRRVVPRAGALTSEDEVQAFLRSEGFAEFAAALAFTMPQSPVDWEDVTSAVIVACDPSAGFALASTLRARWQFAPPVDLGGSFRLPPGLERVSERALLRMLRPEIPGPYRWLMASVVGLIAAHVCGEMWEWEDAREVRVPPVTRLYWHDLGSSSAFRADSSFYGQGAADPSGDEESAWRAAIFRARYEVEFNTWLEVCASVLELYRHPLPDRDRQDAGARRLLETHLASRAQLPLEVVNAASEALGRHASLGRARGWLAPPSSLATSPGVLELWLSAYPGVAALWSPAAGYWYLTFENCDGEVIEVMLTRDEGPPLDLEEDEDEDDHDDRGDLDTYTWCIDRLNASITGAARGHTEIVDIEVSLSEMLDSPAMLAVGRRLAEQVRLHRLSTLFILAPSEVRTWPWGGVVVDDEGTTLAELVPVVHVYTLLPVTTRKSPIRPGVFDCIRGPKEPALRACEAHGVLRFLVRATEHPACGQFTELELDDGRVSALEILGLDLTGCGRVELWTCPLGDLNEAFRTIIPHHGPTGIGSCFLLAGARALVGCPWPVPAMAMGLLMSCFSATAPAPGSPVDDARALARAVREYREMVKRGGVLEQMLRGVLVGGSSSQDDADAVLRRAIRFFAARVARDAVGLSSLGDVDGVVERLMSPLRKRSAWAGWRVFARDARGYSPPREEIRWGVPCEGDTDP